MLTKKMLKTAECVYLHSDGHAVVMHKKTDREAGYVAWVTIHETIGVKVLADDGSWSPGARAKSPGRLIVSKDAIPMVLAAKAIEWRERHPDNGSPASRTAGITFATVSLSFTGHPYEHVTIPLLDCLSGDFTVQADCAETWTQNGTKTMWCSHNVTACIPKEAAEASA